MTTLTLTVRNDTQEIIRLAEEIDAHGAARGWPRKWIFNTNLVLDELITNIISYGYRDADEHEIHIIINEQDDRLVTRMEDDGLPFDPTLVPQIDLDADLDGRRVGGLGWHFARTLMDDIVYEHRDGRNCLTMIQRAPE